MRTPLPTYEVFVGESLPDLSLFLRENTQLISGLDSGHSFRLRVVPVEGGAVVLEKTTGFVGQAGSGFPPLGTPNLRVQWALNDLAELEPDASYRAQLAITRTEDDRVRIYEFLIRTRATL